MARNITAEDLFDAFVGFAEIAKALPINRGEATASGLKHIQSIIDQPPEQRRREMAQIPRRFGLTYPGHLARTSSGRGIEKPIYFSNVSHQHLRSASKQVMLLRAIHAVISHDMKQFAVQSMRSHAGEIGYDVSHKLRYEDDYKPTKSEQKVNDLKRKHVLSLLERPDPQVSSTFQKFISATIADHLEIDRVAIGITYEADQEYYKLSGKPLRPISFTPIDGATIKPTIQYVQQFMRREQIPLSEDGYKRAADILSKRYEAQMRGKTRARDFYELAYVQEVHAQLVNFFTEDEIKLGITSPRSEIGWFGYGESNVEKSVASILAFTYAFVYNVRNFEDGVLPEGVAVVIGDYKADAMHSLKDQLLAQTSGTPLNMHRTPFFNITSDAHKAGADFKFVKFRDHNKDMLYHEWMGLVTALACAVYSFPIEKLHMDKSRTEAPVVDSRSTGLNVMREFAYLRGYLNSFKSMMNELVSTVYPDFVFEWCGIRPDDEEKKLELIKKRDFMTLNEMRARDGLPKYEDVVKDVDVEGFDAVNYAKVAGNLVLHPQLQAINQTAVQGALTPAQDEGEPSLPEFPEAEGEEKEEGKEEGMEKSIITNARFK
jgi:hypothetical protein